jgi:hypothetical protein
MQFAGTTIRPYEAHACGCIGPQNGQPLCPCAMRGVQVVDGRYVRREDLGPVVDSFEPYRKQARDLWDQLMGPKPRKRVKAGSRVVA